MKLAGLGAAVLANCVLAAQEFSFHDPEPAPVRIDIDSANRTFIDINGRQVMFHGVNVVYKVDPYIPSDGAFDSQTSLNDEDIANLVKWGMNFVRLGVMWEAVERTEGTYDDAYLDKVEALINKLGEAGIYTLVDAHQDVFARTMCGEGVPDFYAKEALKRNDYCVNPVVDKLLKPIYDKLGVCTDITSFGFELDANEDPLITDCQSRVFYTYYLTKQSMAAFDALFNNKKGLQDKFVSYWDHVSRRFANNAYVVGYDPLNEPWTAFARDPKLLYPGHMDKQYLAPMYTKIYEKYQSHDTNQQMWFEPVPMPDEIGVLSGYVFPVGFETPPGGEIGSDKHVLNDHTYCCQLGAKYCATGEPSTADAAACLQWHEKRIGQRAKDSERLGVPLVITEFGACLTEAPCSQEINQVGDVADEHLVGWAYWQFKTYADLTTSAGTGSEGFWNQDGTLQDYKVKALARSYMPVTQGILTSQKFDTTTAAFKAEFTYSDKATGTTAAYLNQDYWYQGEPEVTITVLAGESQVVDKAAVGYACSNNYCTFDISKHAGIKGGDKVTITASVASQ